MSIIEFSKNGTAYRAEVELDASGLTDINMVEQLSESGAVQELTDWSELEDDIAYQAAKAKEKLVRHLKVGDAVETLCNLDLEGLKTVHPSKALKTDCEECRKIWRARNKKTGQLEIGEHYKFGDGSMWRCEDATSCSATVVCVLSSPTSAKGKRLTVGLKSAVEHVDLTIATTLLAPPPPPPEATPIATKKIPGKWSQEDVARVVELRQSGLSYISIETKMGWPEGHGNRPFRIYKEWFKLNGVKK